MITLDPELLEILACPACRSPLRAADAAEELACTNASCGLAYPVRDEIPVLLVDEARDARGDGSREPARNAGGEVAGGAQGVDRTYEEGSSTYEEGSSTHEETADITEGGSAADAETGYSSNERRADGNETV